MQQLQELEPTYLKNLSGDIDTRTSARTEPSCDWKSVGIKSKGFGVKFFQSKVKFIQKEENVWVTNCAENKYFRVN